MSYQVLARKYRPKNFETLVGQEHVVRALTHALHSGRLHHAYLFTGTRGVGKTTLSRILAKSLNCIGPDGTGGITPTPCGVCEACTAIDAGRFVDYIEMDAASNRGVDEMAQLLEQAVYAPSNARFKVYMIDEVHMLTNHAFNSMLKTLEEPPEHVKFILATTDPQKIPVTVLSRCLQFNLKQMPPGHIIGHLDNILGQEGITFEAPALRLLAAGAHGSMRDALSLTDQAIAYAAGAVTLDAVQGMLGALDQSYLIRLLDALAAQDGADLLAVADEMATRSLSYNGALQDLGTLLHRIALAQTVPAALPEDLPEYADIVRLAAAFDAEEVQLYYQIAVHGRNELGLAPDEYAGFSMTLLRMLAFRPGVGGAEGQPAAAPAMSRPAAVAAARAAAAPPARAAAHMQASHASVTPAAVVAGAAAAMARAEAPAAAAFAAPAAQTPSANAMSSAPIAPPAPAPVVAPVAAPAANVAPAPAPVAAAPAAPTAPAGPMSPARAAINAALEAARAASKPGGRSSSAGAAPAATAPAPAAEPSPAPSFGAAPSAAPSAPPQSQAPSAAYTPPAAPVAVAPSRPAPWEDMPPETTMGGDAQAAVLEAPVRQVAPQQVAPQAAPAAKPAQQQADEEDDLPPWVTEFSDDSAVAQSAPAQAYAPSQPPSYSPSHSPSQAASHTSSQAPSHHQAPPPLAYADEAQAVVMPARAAPAPAKAPHAYVITPVPELNWDGNWPAVAAALPLRGVAQQLAMQAELIECRMDGNAVVFNVRVPIETWRTPGNVEKLTVALTERFGRPVRVDTELGAVWYTASAEAQAHREACQRAAEDTVANDSFVNSMIREFDAWVVPGSITPPPAALASAAAN
ncbi:MULTISPECIES: DNA polymerase III subunit gamma/tau [unclassified Duganella]|uniref:DNA polymerase III subunit gamma/tau n=1 Tax=unclassified Duganella TaxID=2636909 RepID=UPI000E34E402|nr:MULTISPECIES: DNA polymerase III subunit gamma/tau [unclassified Duganella]RFP15796.1 DNA polymerase III subunit gamma/tau [Duganella sp. BJB475]RFP33039.1 DNA polymerase III subunit gamma/tau [Duganella sp. BJB476]